MRRTRALALVLGSAAGAAALRRLRAGRAARVDLYFTDGSMVSLEEGSPQADRLVPLAREVLAAARTA